MGAVFGALSLVLAVLKIYEAMKDPHSRLGQFCHRTFCCGRLPSPRPVTGEDNDVAAANDTSNSGPATGASGTGLTYYSRDEESNNTADTNNEGIQSTNT